MGTNVLAIRKVWKSTQPTRRLVVVLPKMIVALRIALAAMIARTGSGGTREKGRMAPIAQTANAAATGLPGRIR